MKKIIIINMIMICPFLMANAQQNIKSDFLHNEKVEKIEKHSGSSNESSLDVFTEETEKKIFELRNNNKIDYDVYLNKINSQKEAALEWNEYFNYSKNKGANIMSAQGSWTNISCNTIDHTTFKGGAMGRINCVRTDPNNADIVYAGSPAGGLWKSGDGGDSWTCLTDGLPRIGVTDIAINPFNSNEIYILTGDGDANLSASIGVLKSFNGGFTWQPTGLMFLNSTGFNFNDSTKIQGRKIIMSPFNPDLIYVVISDGIYKTINGGITWPKVYSGADIWDINFKPGFDTVIYAAGTNTFYRSNNSGLSWIPTQNFPGGQRISISTTLVALSTVYALVSLGPEKAQFYLSTNSGTSFIITLDTPNVISGQTPQDIALEVSPVSASTVYAGVLNMYKSTNQGMNFNTISNAAYSFSNYVKADVHDIEIRNGIIYVATDGGIYKSIDGGITWLEKINGLSVAWVTGLAHAPAFPDLFYFSSWDNGLFRRTSGSACKNQMSNDGLNVAIDYTNQNTAYGNVNFVVSKTTDGGNNWNPIYPPTNFFSRCMAISPTNANILYIAANDIFKSADKGNTWIPLHADSSYGRSCIALSVSNPNCIYSATRPYPYSPGVYPNYFQRYDGTSWISCAGNLPSYWTYWFCPSDVTVDPTNHMHAWMIFCGFKNGMKVYETSNGGSTWQNRSGTLPNVNINCIRYGSSGNNSVYIGTDIGVFYRDSSNTDWIPFLNGLPRTIVTDLSVDNANGFIYAATNGRGIWQSELFSACPSYLVFSGAPYNTQGGFQFYEAGNTIESDRYINGSYGNNIIYKAGNYINFVPGFEALAGCEVRASIGACNGQPIAKILSGTLDEQQISNSESGSSAQLLQTGNASELNLKVVPEPHTEYINVEFVSSGDAPLSIVITDILGHTIESIIKNENFASGRHTLQISTIHHKSGIYAITFAQGNNVLTKKIMKL